MTATILKFPPRIPPKAEAAIDFGIYFAVEEVAASRHLSRLYEAEAMLLAAAEYRYALGAERHAQFMEGRQ